MRLKFLFFPLILVVSISIFIGYIWPEISNLRIANEEKMKHVSEVEGINNKKAAIQRIDAEINGDNEGETIINNYLPNAKVEERILTSVNFLASDSEVSLVDLSFDNGNPEKKNENVELLSSGSPLSAAIASNAVNTSNPDNQKADAIGDKQVMHTTIMVSGEYEKIRLFIDQLQKMSPLNSIKNLTISSQTEESDKQGDVAEGEDTSNTQVSSSELSAEMNVDFYWMSPVKIDSQKIANFKSGLDNDTIAVVKQYVSQKAPSVDKFGDASGKRNPFLQ